MKIFNGFKQLFKQKEEKIMTNFSDLQAKRRSIYALGKDVNLTNQELIDTIQGAILQTPSAFNSQTSRVVFCWMKSQMLSGMRLPTQNLKK